MTATALRTDTPSPTDEPARTVRSLVPARLDRLPWTRFHWLVVTGLGVSWILDGLEIQIVALVGTVLVDKGTLHLTAGDIGFLASVYLLGEVIGALVFGRITDHIGRKKMFMVCLGLYLCFSGLGAFSFNLWSLLVCRFVAGLGIGGEYTAINSAIDELIPSHYRGRVDIAVNGTYWLGAMIGAAASILLLNPQLLPVNVGWRLAFFIGPMLGVGVIFLRRTIPESPRWLMTHGRQKEAEQIVDEIEQRVERQGVHLEPVPEDKAIELTGAGRVSYVQIARTMLREYPGRSFLGFTMMATQAFLYNAIFFTYALVLTSFYHVAAANTALYFFPFAAGNLLGPLTIGHLFDTIGRRKMILTTYCVSGVLLAISGFLFHQGILNALTQTLMWCVIFFLASAGASSAYLTVSEIFPLELRGQAISFFFAISQLAGGVAAPSIFGALIGSGKDAGPLSIGYYAGGAIMFLGGLVAWFFGVNAERRPLEDIATPLSAAKRSQPAAERPALAT
ncbi:MAG: MFS transporter [Candidatus Dormiibacterota bacterium]